jgi:hypothetical protein
MAPNCRAIYLFVLLLEVRALSRFVMRMSRRFRVIVKPGPGTAPVLYSTALD